MSSSSSIDLDAPYPDPLTLPWGARLSLARDGRNPEVLAVLSRSPEHALLRYVAGNPNTPPASLAALAEHTPTPAVCEALAANPACPAPVLAALTRPGTTAARVRVAGNPSTDVATLTRLGRSSPREVLIALAGNPHTPSSTLDRVARRLYSARLATDVAANPNVAPDTLAYLLERYNAVSQVYADVLLHPDTPVPALTAQLSLPGPHAAHLSTALLVALSTNPALDFPDVVAALVLAADMHIIPARARERGLVKSLVEETVLLVAIERAFFASRASGVEQGMSFRASTVVNAKAATVAGLEAVEVWRSASPAARALGLDVWESLPPTVSLAQALSTGKDLAEVPGEPGVKLPARRISAQRVRASSYGPRSR